MRSAFHCLSSYRLLIALRACVAASRSALRSSAFSVSLFSVRFAVMAWLSVLLRILLDYRRCALCPRLSAGHSAARLPLCGGAKQPPVEFHSAPSASASGASFDGCLCGGFHGFD